LAYFRHKHECAVLAIAKFSKICYTKILSSWLRHYPSYELKIPETDLLRAEGEAYARGAAGEVACLAGNARFVLVLAVYRQK
jgi:hypothetical protein